MVGIIHYISTFFICEHKPFIFLIEEQEAIEHWHVQDAQRSVVVILLNVVFVQKYRKMVDAARSVHTAQTAHVHTSGEGNTMSDMGQLRRLLIEAHRETPSFSGIPRARQAETLIGNYLST